MSASPAGSLFSFLELVQREVSGGFEPTDRWKVIKHQDRREGAPDLASLFLFSPEAFEFYQADQSKPVFNCEGIFSFVGLPDRRALFVGAWTVQGTPEEVDAPRLEEVPRELHALYGPLLAAAPDKRHLRYKLERDARFDRLAMRVVIDWGAGDRSWHQWDLEKAVHEVRPPGALEPCPALADIDVSLRKLQHLARNEAANSSWRDRLSALGGIYLLTNQRNGKLYVGQAGGEEGFWGRWKEYAGLKSGNVAVDPALASGELDPDHTSFSVLDEVPLGGDKARLDALENRWKRRLCSRGEGGYNKN